MEWRDTAQGLPHSSAVTVVGSTKFVHDSVIYSINIDLNKLCTSINEYNVNIMVCHFLGGFDVD